MGPYRRYRQRLTLLLRAAADAHRYWTADAATWEAFGAQARADGIEVAGLLRDMDLQILDRSAEGAVRLGTPPGA